MPPAIELRSIRKEYRSRSGAARRALDGLDLEVQAGTIFGFVGPNGAGKSTALKILVGLVHPTSGSAHLFGTPCGTRESRARLGFLPEVANYHPFMGVQELLHVHAALAGVAPGERPGQCAQALSAVGLEGRAQSRLGELSKGMRQRFGIAQALVGRPSLLILDELTSGLDPQAQCELKTIVLSLKERGITVFFSSHHMAEVESVCDQIGIIHLGQLRACGSLAELAEPASHWRLRYRLGDAGEQELTLSEPACQHKLAEVIEEGGSVLLVQPVQASLDEIFQKVTSSS